MQAVEADKRLAVTVDSRGRLVVPASLRHRLGLEPGVVLVARTEGERLVLEPRSAILARLRERYAAVPAGISLADELIAERREATRREPAG